MRANLIYNPNSGGTDGVSPDELCAALAAAGYDPVYEPTNSEEDLDALLKRVDGLVVAVGGDGTVRAAATRLIGRGVPLAVAPAGTANNIGRTFGLQGGPLEILAGLKDPLRRGFDVGRVTSPWGVDYFLEAFGYGLYADILYFYAPEQGKSLLRSISALSQTLSTPRRHICRVALDGEEITGDFLMLEALNTTAMGPRVKLAPAADPDDGLLEVVRIREDNRDSLLAYLNGLLTETLDELPSVEVSCGRRLEITCEEGFPFHVDAEVRPYTALALDTEPAGGDQDGERQGLETQPTEPSYQFPRPEGPIVVDILPQALEIWLPQPVEGDLPA